MYVSYELQGDTEGLALTSSNMPSGFSYSADTQKLRVHAKRAREGAMKIFGKYVSTRGRQSKRDQYGNTKTLNAPNEMINRYLELYARDIRLSLGMKPKSVIVPLSFFVEVENDYGEKANRSATVFVALTHAEAERAIQEALFVGIPGLMKKVEYTKAELERKKKELKALEEDLARRVKEAKERGEEIPKKEERRNPRRRR